jgi:hypothetical protein
VISGFNFIIVSQAAFPIPFLQISFRRCFIEIIDFKLGLTIVTKALLECNQNFFLLFFLLLNSLKFQSKKSKPEVTLTIRLLSGANSIPLLNNQGVKISLALSASFSVVQRIMKLFAYRIKM